MDNRNRDRGAIKWTSLMLPEHVEMVKQVWKEDERIEKPILDEQQWEEIGFKLHRSITGSLPVVIRYHNGFNYSDEKVKVVQLDSQSRKVKLINLQDKVLTSLQFKDIVDVNII